MKGAKPNPASKGVCGRTWTTVISMLGFDSVAGTGRTGSPAAFRAPNRAVASKCFCLGFPDCTGDINMLVVSTLVSTQRLWVELEPR